ncbi:unnamed protein product [Urochloa decumbens]|uniref:Poor homologous synapsis 1 PH domain-containing protein n=1 Tax=Urochloa decumbens TaxID=240449 RepID=A0ABC9CCK2_9POAL
MADADDDSRALVPADPDASTVAAPQTRTRRQKWEVEYARYFGTLRQDSSASPPPGLRYITRGAHRHQGTWLPASSSAALCVSRPTLSSAVPVLTVCIGDVVFEEHFVSILNFSWPQVTCGTQCPIRGSRVVFMSFCDKSKQVAAAYSALVYSRAKRDASPLAPAEAQADVSPFIFAARDVAEHSRRLKTRAFLSSQISQMRSYQLIQKFAVRFPQLCDAESFLNCVKECSWETMDIIPSGSDYVCEDTSASEYIASNGLHHRPDDASSYEEQASDHMMEALTVSYHEEPEHMIEAPTMNYHEEPDLPVLQPLSASHTNNSYSGFPPSFSQMLANCSTKDEQDTEESYPVGATNHAPQEVYAPDNSHDVAVAVATEEMIADKGMDAVAGIDTSILTGDIVTRIKTMSDDSFKDMLFKLEKVIDELGGDMSL